MYIKVQVTPDAKRDSVDVVSKTKLKISVKAPAAQNLANRRVIELVATHFHISENQVRIISGHRSQSKMLSVDIT